MNKKKYQLSDIKTPGVIKIFWSEVPEDVFDEVPEEKRFDILCLDKTDNQMKNKTVICFKKVEEFENEDKLKIFVKDDIIWGV